MKLLLITALLMSSAFADHTPEHKEKAIGEVKERIAANIDQKIGALNAHKSCVQGAADREALKACRKSHKDAMKKLHEENKGEKAAWKESRKSKKESRKKN